MPALQPIYGLSSTFNVASLVNLASDPSLLAGWQSDFVNNLLVMGDDEHVSSRFQVGTNPIAGTEIRIYVYASIEDIGFPDTISGIQGSCTLTSAAVRDAALTLAVSIKIDANPNRWYSHPPFSVAALFGGSMPPKWGLFVVQNTRAQVINAVLSHRMVQYQTATSAPTAATVALSGLRVNSTIGVENVFSGQAGQTQITGLSMGSTVGSLSVSTPSAGFNASAPIGGFALHASAGNLSIVAPSQIALVGQTFALRFGTPTTSGGSNSTVPTFNHVVVVTEENHDYSSVASISAMPYAYGNLATNGAWFTNYQSISGLQGSSGHYIIIYSGDNHGITNNSFVSNVTGITLADISSAAGLAFGAFADGTFHSDQWEQHLPWMWFGQQSVDGALGVGQPTSAFPQTTGAFATMPRLTIFSPSYQHNMHDGSITQADNFLQTNFSNYATWAKNNNSLLIIWWDETASGSGGAGNTGLIFYGANIATGHTASGPWNERNLAPTLAMMGGFAVPSAWPSSSKTPITGVYVTPSGAGTAAITGRLMNSGLGTPVAQGTAAGPPQLTGLTMGMFAAPITQAGAQTALVTGATAVFTPATLATSTSGGAAGTPALAAVPSASFAATRAGLTAAITAVGNGGTVYVYSNVDITGGITLTNGASMIGQGFPTLSNGTVTVGAPISETQAPVVLANFGIVSPSSDGVRMAGGYNVSVENIWVDMSGAGRDGLHVEATANGRLNKCGSVKNMKVWHAGHDGFHWETGNFTAPTYIDSFFGCNLNIRWVPNSWDAQLITNTTSTGANHRISCYMWLNGEADSSGAPSADEINVVFGGDAMDHLQWNSVAIEDTGIWDHGTGINTHGHSSVVTSTNNIISGSPEVA